MPSRVGMRFEPRLPFEHWREVGTRLAMYTNASQWWLGDWLVFGRYKYGRRYKQGVALTGLDYQTLRNYAVVARRFELSRRRDKLSFQHHAEVCTLADEEQEEWLDRAETFHWSRNELRRRLRARLGSAEPATVMEILQLTVEAERQQRWREAAARRVCGLEEWIVATLDEAADAVIATDP